MMAIESPQIPGLVGGRPNGEEMLRDLDDILQLAGIDTAKFDHIYHHEQLPVVSPAGNEFLVRVMFDDDPDEIRERTGGRMLAAVENGYEDAENHLDRHPPLVTGERLMIAVAGTDTMGWCLDQLNEGAGAVIEWNREADACWGMPLVPSGSNINETYSLEELGLDRNSTVEECLDRVIAREVDGMSHTYFWTSITA